ncbi:hypothetical protein [Deinococcus maricopensis]|uniref:Uncharacterized protein n=1 Tax=Deinococcus maricopensis (strain DSM 21211 / LMG 22137 / NRRL B-23946 / LB-34) TaxID=709986 RepID=E8U3H2_DEIML|nr:hypothetical protein [Deinococcus maricopensis]ADV65843.1 hypothetical protein Deima_0179 [Deinococcus maricopensis DSM 21211]
MNARVSFTLQGTPVLHAEGRMCLGVVRLNATTRTARPFAWPHRPPTEVETWRLADGRLLRITRPAGTPTWTVEAVLDEHAA